MNGQNEISWPSFVKVQSHVILAPHSSWLVGGVADFFCEPSNLNSLAELIGFAAKLKMPVTILGGGTNVLISDQGIRGLVISLSKLTGLTDISIEKNLVFWALAGTPKSELLKIFLKHKITAALFLAGLPGQVGGGVVMNAGVSENIFPKEFQSIVSGLEVVRPDGKIQSLNSSELKWKYRHCEGWRPGVIARVQITVPYLPDDGVLAAVKKLNQSRLSKQPLEWPSCGSVFQNPLPMTAGKLIEEAGLKGTKVGGAQVSEKHANFIINREKATAKDIKALMDLCVLRVREKFSVELKSEVVWLGEQSSDTISQ